MDQEKVFAVFGLGTFGMEICNVLSSKGKEVIAVDRDGSLVDKVKDSVTQALLVDSTDEDALKAAGMEDVDVAVIAIGDNLEASILTTIILKNLGVPCIIARAVSAIHAQTLKQVGATELVNIEVDEGRRLANRIVSPDIMDIIPISPEQSMAELRAPRNFLGKSLKQLDLRNKFSVNVVSVKRVKTDIDELGNPKRDEMIFTPRPMDIIEANDILVVIGCDKDIEALREAAA